LQNVRNGRTKHGRKKAPVRDCPHVIFFFQGGENGPQCYRDAEKSRNFRFLTTPLKKLRRVENFFEKKKAGNFQIFERPILLNG